MARSLESTHGRATHANFIGIPRNVADSKAFTSLSVLARALYVDLRRQYSGRNNGDITIADSVLSQYGWAHSSVHKALKELVFHKLVQKVFSGGVKRGCKKPSLYAFSDLPVMANPSKGIHGSMPSLAYRDYSPVDASAQPAKKKTTVHIVTSTVHRMDEVRLSA